MIKHLLIFVVIACCFSCMKESRVEKEIAQVDVNFEIYRFDREFAQANPEDLPELKDKYPFLFPEQYPDSVWVAMMQDSIQQEIEIEVQKAFPNLEEEKDELHRLFQHIKYYFPEFEEPDVITLTSEVDYKNKVIAADDKLLISLDTYLGEEHHFYMGLQTYLKKNFRREQIAPDAAQAYAEKFVPRPENRTFLAHLVYYGKIQYLKQVFVPFKKDWEIIGYTEEELQWAKANEEQIWRYFIENQIIYDTDSQLYTRFLYPGPFSKFYLELDNESPDRLGQFIGLQMLRQYMERNQVSPQEMLEKTAEEIFKNSNYKPKK